MESRIARVEVFPLRYPEPHDGGKLRYITLTRIETDDGAVGWGECISQWPEAALAVKTVIDQGMAQLILGEDPLDVRRLWERLRSHAFWTGGGGIVSFAISALDIALWDVAGRLRGLPVHALLGGRLHDRVRSCASIILDTLDLDRTREQFSSYRDRGYTAVKGGWGVVPEAGFGTDARRDLQVARTVREAVGPEVDVALDVSARAQWNATRACAMARQLDEVGLAWLEDALPHDDLAGWRRLRAAAPMALATGERCWTTSQYRDLVDSGAVDIVLIDPGRVDGLSGMWEAAKVAAAAGVRFVPHSWSSAINTAAALHVFAAMPNGHVFELKPEVNPMQHELVATPFEQVDGWLAVPDAPGLGIDVDEDVVREYTFD
jgi:L-alanine-DL-glutamate epimerase-like enolase superfamily enzyme